MRIKSRSNSNYLSVELCKFKKERNNIEQRSLNAIFHRDILFIPYNNTIRISSTRFGCEPSLKFHERSRSRIEGIALLPSLLSYVAGSNRRWMSNRLLEREQARQTRRSSEQKGKISRPSSCWSHPGPWGENPWSQSAGK